MSRILIVAGICLAAIGLFWPWLGRLPGDIWIHRGNFTFYAPITTSIFVSLIFTLIFWLLGR